MRAVSWLGKKDMRVKEIPRPMITDPVSYNLCCVCIVIQSIRGQHKARGRRRYMHADTCVHIEGGMVGAVVVPRAASSVSILFRLPVCLL
jgi:hypothetical protein